MKVELIDVAHVDVNFYDKSKFQNNTIHECKNFVDDNENKHKNLLRIFDDDYDLLNKVFY